VPEEAALIARLASLGKTFVAAESCTAGLVAARAARIPGASAALWGSFVTYQVEAKVRALGVDAVLLARHGAVSRETAEAMARGALERSGADYAVSVTGLAGPDGDGSGTPVGTVWVGVAGRGGAVRAACFRFAGERNAVREAAAGAALEELLRYVDTEGVSA